MALTREQQGSRIICAPPHMGRALPSTLEVALDNTMPVQTLSHAPAATCLGSHSPHARCLKRIMWPHPQIERLVHHAAPGLLDAWPRLEVYAHALPSAWPGESSRAGRRASCTVQPGVTRESCPGRAYMQKGMPPGAKGDGLPVERAPAQVSIPPGEKESKGLAVCVSHALSMSMIVL